MIQSGLMEGPSSIVELVPGKLWVLGGSVDLDGRVSWVPPKVRGRQPVNTYLLVDQDLALVIDPGVARHEETVVRQLRDLLPAIKKVSIFVTRAEQDCIGNIGGISTVFTVDRLFAGGGSNPFDAFDSVTLNDPDSRGERIQIARMKAGYKVPVSLERGVEIVHPAIRLLATFWGYDEATRVLFTSDAFGHTIQPQPHSPRVIDDTDEQADVESVRDHLFAKFGWLASARTQAVAANLRDIFERREIEMIAPGHGCVLRGPEVVNRHYDLIQQILREVEA